MNNEGAPLPSCPLPIAEYPQVLLAHGGGGQLMHQLLDRLVLPALCTNLPEHDSALIDTTGVPLAVTTDSFVVQPLEFPGGNIGTLAACGTFNDLAVAGARPRQLAVSLILEEGLHTNTLWRMLVALRQVADAAGVQVVTGDTKVVERGHGDGLYITTTGIGEQLHPTPPHPRNVRPGDVILVSGDLARHGIAVLAARERLRFEPPIRSDCADLSPLVDKLLATPGIQWHCLRDLTRGGLGGALTEVLTTAGCGASLEETAIPVAPPTATACDLLGLDPLFVACEGRLVAFVPEAQSEPALRALRSQPLGEGAAIIGNVCSGRDLYLRNALGIDRPLRLPAGEQLPRIC
ncbi:MAG: hydrogenase expression/formation protein HypE [Pseudomonadota bacterium]|nr:hydrogenase expression/formation protein HypE [Pseudomonadota bacterium]